ncbi:MAG: hypothetical protein EZS28_009248 [Streblomastix strix]|uniref:Uncharacterized protein n=1 Tax=Streblomastix strix TaxID=222440 RepID=A0A5J4WJN2_9EUKA|nr:MAG: hypothetical protein EZS28_009248 [Streblomastix strix]
MAQSCQVSWQITIPAGRLALQLNLAATATTTTEALARARVNFYGLDDQQADQFHTMQCGDVATQQPIDHQEHIKLQIEQAVIAANSLSDECTRNSVSVSSLESIVRGRRHCGIFLDIPVSRFAADSFNYTFPFDITIAGVLDLNQLNPIFNSFPVLTRNYASLYLQLWTQDFLQDLKVVWLNKSNTYTNTHLAYQMIPREKSDLIYLLNTADNDYAPYNVRIVNIEGKEATERKPTNTISQIKDTKFTKLDIINVGFNMENGE